MDWSGDMLGMAAGVSGSGVGVFNNTTSLDLSCAARNIQGPIQSPYSAVLVIMVRILQSTLLAFVCFAGLFLNILVIVLVAKYKKLQTVPFGIALHIAILDILFIINLFFGLVNSLANRWLFGRHMCSILGAFLLSIGVMRTYIIFVFVIDRFFSVFLPFTYPKHETKSIIILSVAHWLVALVFVVLAYVLDCYTFIPNGWICMISPACSKICSLVSSVFILLVAPASIVPIFLYASLFVKAKKAKKAMAATSECEGGPNQVKYDWKATITFFLMFITVFSTSLPNLFVLLVIRTVYGDKQLLPPVMYIVSIIATRIVAFQPLADPIFILRNGDVREVISEAKQRYFQGYCPRQCGNRDNNADSN